MVNRTQPQNTNDVQEKIPQPPQNVVGDDAEAHRQRIFAERFDKLMNGFGEACESESVGIAVAIAIHPKEDKPLIFVRGEVYDVSCQLAALLREMKHIIANELRT